jgi:hypothetical protein
MTDTFVRIDTYAEQNRELASDLKTAEMEFWKAKAKQYFDDLEVLWYAALARKEGKSPIISFTRGNETVTL